MKKLTKIPSEFSLAKYDAVADFVGSEEWFVNLEKRYELFALCNTPFHLIDTKNVDGLAAAANMQSSTREKVLRLLENPIITIEESGGLLYLSSDDAVVSLKNKDFFEMLRCVHFHDEANYQNVLRLITTYCKPDEIEHPRDFNLIHKRFWNDDISPELTAFAKVDLYASDDKLIDDFMAWVKVEKEKRFINIVDNKGGSKIPDKIRKHAPTQADLKQWTKNKVLPCLDLMIWAKVNQLKITNEMLAGALFSMNLHVDDTTLKVTRSTRNKADELMDQATLMIFANAVKKEIAPEPKPFYAEDFLQRIKNGVASASKKS
ncbi:MAG: DUF6387 family protein [Methylococcales bacterium]